MDLKEFVAQTIIEVIDGVQMAQEHVKETNAKVSPQLTNITTPKDRYIFDYKSETRYAVNNIEFDVAVTTFEGDELKASIGVLTGIFGAGAQGRTEASNTAMNRIKFSVPVVFPTQFDPDLE